MDAAEAAAFAEASVDASLDASLDAPWVPTLHACGLSPTGAVQLPLPPAGPSVTPACAGSDQVALSAPQVTAPDGGAIMPGSSATWSVVVAVADGGPLSVGYPCVAISASDPGVTFAPDEGPELYVIAPGTSVTFSGTATLGPTTAAGAMQMAAWAVWGSDGDAGCANAAPLVWAVHVE